MPLALLAALAAAAGPQSGALRVRAAAAVAPCVEAAARAYGQKSVAVEPWTLGDAAPADVFVGSAAEVARALEGGWAVPDSDAEVARVRWVLVVPAGNPNQIRGLGDANRAGIEVWVAGGPAAHAARRIAREAAPERVREASDGAVPDGAAAALVPLCLAGADGERLPVDVPDLVVEAAVSARASRAQAARDFVAFLASTAARSAFAAGP